MFRSWFPTAGMVALAVILVATDVGEGARRNRRNRGNNAPVYDQSVTPAAFYPAGPEQDGTMQRSYYPPEGNSNSVGLEVMVPMADAVVLIDGERTTQTGLQRRYVSPPLTPGTNYSYEVKATWMRDGQPVTRTRRVNVRAGQRVTVDLTREMSGTRDSRSDD